MERTILLNNGIKLPPIGFGTYKTAESDGAAVILDAVKAGYRFFDTASLYETERALGEAVKHSGVARHEFIIETKLWIDEMGYREAKEACERSLKRLGLDYIDLYLIHWPRPSSEGEEWRELDRETWRAMESLLKEGKVRGIGCSNFLPHHLRNLMKDGGTVPVVDQLEMHPGYSQEAAAEYCRSQGIVPLAWSPLGRGRANSIGCEEYIKQLAEKYGKSAAQIYIRFLVQKGIVPCVKASSYEHMKANLNVFDFELTEDELSVISCMPQTAWLGEHPDFAIPTKRSNFEQ